MLLPQPGNPTGYHSKCYSYTTIRTRLHGTGPVRLGRALLTLKKLYEKVMRKIMLIAIQIPRIICPKKKKRSIHIPVPSQTAKQRYALWIREIKRQNEKKEHRIHSMPSGEFVCTPQLLPTPCAMQCIPSIPAIGLFALAGAGNKDTKPWETQRQFLSSLRIRTHKTCK